MSRFVQQLGPWLRRSLPWIALAAFVAYSASGSSSGATVPTGSQFPALSAALADGSQLALAAPQQVTVLNFWASYCAPCRAEAPMLSALQAQAADIKVVGLSVEAFSAEETQRRANQIGMRYAVGVADEALQSRLRVQSVPTTYVIAKSGKVVLSRVGVVSSRELEAALAAGRDAI